MHTFFWQFNCFWFPWDEFPGIEFPVVDFPDIEFARVEFPGVNNSIVNFLDLYFIHDFHGFGFLQWVSWSWVFWSWDSWHWVSLSWSPEVSFPEFFLSSVSWSWLWNHISERELMKIQNVPWIDWLNRSLIWTKTNPASHPPSQPATHLWNNFLLAWWCPIFMKRET